MALPKILQTLDVLFSKEILYRIWRKLQSNPKFPTRNEYAAIGVTTDSTEDVFECEPMCTRKSGASLL